MKSVCKRLFKKKLATGSLVQRSLTASSSKRPFCHLELTDNFEGKFLYSLCLTLYHKTGCKPSLLQNLREM